MSSQGYSNKKENLNAVSELSALDIIVQKRRKKLKLLYRCVRTLQDRLLISQLQYKMLIKKG